MLLHRTMSGADSIQRKERTMQQYASDCCYAGWMCFNRDTKVGDFQFLNIGVAPMGERMTVRRFSDVGWYSIH
jgi:hypothetical protein